MMTISGLNHTARSLAVYASQPGSPRHHARLAPGCWPALPGGAGYPQGPIERFPLYASPFPELSWRTQLSPLLDPLLTRRKSLDNGSKTAIPSGISTRRCFTVVIIDRGYPCQSHLSRNGGSPRFTSIRRHILDVRSGSLGGFEAHSYKCLISIYQTEPIPRGDRRASDS